MGSHSNEGDGPRKSVSSDSQVPTVVRHGYGVQYWNDGAHYEGQWKFNKADG